VFECWVNPIPSSQSTVPSAKYPSIECSDTADKAAPLKGYKNLQKRKSIMHTIHIILMRARQNVVAGCFCVYF